MGDKINWPRQLAPPPGSENKQGEGQDIPGYLHPRVASCPGGGGKINRPGQLAPGVEITRVGARYPGIYLPLRKASCPGGQDKCIY